MHIAILTFEGFNELDSLVAYSILNRHRAPGWRVSLAGPSRSATSMNGLTVPTPTTIEEACRADAVLVGSGVRTRELAADAALMESLRLDPDRQLIGAQCSGALILARLGLLGDGPACTDLTTRPWVEGAGVRVLDRPFHAAGRVATAGGCLASQYLAAWIMASLVGEEAARAALHYVAPVGEKELYVRRAMEHVGPHLVREARSAAPASAT